MLYQNGIIITIIFLHTHKRMQYLIAVTTKISSNNHNILRIKIV